MINAALCCRLAGWLAVWLAGARTIWNSEALPSAAAKRGPIGEIDGLARQLVCPLRLIDPFAYVSATRFKAAKVGSNLAETGCRFACARINQLWLAYLRGIRRPAPASQPASERASQPAGQPENQRADQPTSQRSTAIRASSNRRAAAVVRSANFKLGQDNCRSSRWLSFQEAA